jgi:hypothetical protein
MAVWATGCCDTSSRTLLGEHNAIYKLVSQLAENEPHPLRRAITAAAEL